VARRERQAGTIDLKTGDRVLFGKWSGTEVKIDSVDYLIMKESDIMACSISRSPQEGRVGAVVFSQRKPKWLPKK